MPDNARTAFALAWLPAGETLIAAPPSIGARPAAPSERRSRELAARQARGPVKHRDVRHGFVLGHPMIHAGIFERYFDFVSCLILSFLSAASLANRRSFSRAVFARTAWPAASYSDMAFVASVARSSFCVRFNWASASVRFFEWLAMIAPIRHRTAIRPVMFG